METILNITYLYLLVLMLALLVERTMEVVMACWNMCELKLNAFLFWNKRTQKLMDRFANEVQSGIATREMMGSGLKKRIRHYTLVDQDITPGKTVVFSSKAVRHVFVRTFSLIVTSIMGVLLCYFAGINLIVLIKSALAPHPVPFLDVINPPLQRILSGLIIGLGAEPVHRFIKGLEDSRAWLDQRNRLNNALKNSPLQPPG